MQNLKIARNLEAISVVGNIIKKKINYFFKENFKFVKSKTTSTQD